MPFLGIDHVDLRVPVLNVVESFYDTFFSRLGLTRKEYAWVEFGGALRGKTGRPNATTRSNITKKA